VEGAVYVLCALTSLICAVLLWRGFGRSGTRLLLWCGIFFLAMTLENAILFVDVIHVPSIDLSDVRRAVPLIGVVLLLYGLIWEAK
jgi:hypothetical protein